MPAVASPAAPAHTDLLRGTTAPAPTVAASVGDPIVYVTKSGTKYHLEGCSFLRGGGTAIPLTQAKAKYEPCSKCHPPG